MDVLSTREERELLAASRGGDEGAFSRLVEPHRRELHAHCYRMLGSLHDAEDALQETLLGAWRGLARFEGRSSLRSWLFTIATNACLRLIEGRRRRILPAEHGPAADPSEPLGEPLEESVWVEPYPDEFLRYERRESVELAYVAALQHLPATQRAVLILREVLGFSAAETAESLDTTVASINSSLQRARQGIAERLPQRSQQATLRELGDARARELVDAFVAAWERQDVEGIVAMLAAEATFSMPPLPNCYRGREDVAAFIAQRVFATPRHFLPLRASGQPAMAGWQCDPESGRYRLGALNVLSLEGGKIAAITSSVNPVFLARFFGLPEEVPAPER